MEARVNSYWPITVFREKAVDKINKEQRSWIMSQVRSTGNKSTELALVDLFRKHKITGWRRNYPTFGHPDFTFPRKRVVIFVDGCFWHGHPQKCRIPSSNRDYWIRKIERNVARDKLVTKTLREKGWIVVRFWEDEITKTSTVNRLRKVLDKDER